MQEMCGATARPSAAISATVFQVPARVDPPAPKVTEKNAGLSAASCVRTERNLASPSAVRGGKSSKLNVGAPIASRGLIRVRPHALRTAEWRGNSADSAQVRTL